MFNCNLISNSYEERKRSLETVAGRHKDSNTFEEFAARIYSPIPLASSTTALGGSITTTTTTTTLVTAAPPLAAALIDHHHRSSTKSAVTFFAICFAPINCSPKISLGWHQHPEVIASAREISQQTLAMTTIALDHPSPRSHRKLTHPFKSAPKSSKHNTPPDSPTLPTRKFK